MYLTLGEGDGDPLPVESGLDFLQQIKINFPVISSPRDAPPD
jgi:hypothetical protein